MAKIWKRHFKYQEKNLGGGWIADDYPFSNFYFNYVPECFARVVGNKYRMIDNDD